MKKAITLISVLFLITASVSLVNAQRGANLDDLNRPDVVPIIGVYHPMDWNAAKFLEDNIDREDTTDDFDTGVSDFGDKNDDDDFDDILDDYIDDLEDEEGGEPEKEELVLEKLGSLNSVEVVLYPNPATNFINVNVDNEQNFEIEVYDLIGNLVITQKLGELSNTENRLDISNLQKGVYLMHIISTTERLIKKFGVN